MERRSFIKHAGVAGILAAGVSPAVHAESPAIKWRLASTFPKSLDTIFGAAETFSESVKKMSGGRFDISVFPAGEVLPAFEVLDGVSKNTVQMGHVASYYWVGKNKAFGFDTAIPFGLSARQQNAWLYYGGGLALMREFFAGYNVVNFPGGNTGTQMGGWFRKEIKTLADVKGLKMRIPGIGGEIWKMLDAVPQAIPGGDIYPALEKGTIDAAEWVGPYDDEKLGFYKVAPNYYYPGWWEGGPNLSFLINKSEWDKLPKDYQAMISTAAAEANVNMLAEYDAKNPAALGRLLKQGVKIHPFPKEFMDAAFKAAHQLYDDEAGKNPAFKKIWTNWSRFRNEQWQWTKVAENSFHNYMANQKL